MATCYVCSKGRKDLPDMYTVQKAIPISQLRISRLTVVSREAKKKQHARASSGLRDHYSELFTRMAALKFENAVTQSP